MPTYEQRTPQVEAEQWDGTIEGSNKIIDLLPEGYDHITILTESGEGRDFYSRLTFDRPVCEHNQMRPLNWLLKHLNGKYEVMHDEEFQQLYDVPSQRVPS